MQTRVSLLNSFHSLNHIGSAFPPAYDWTIAAASKCNLSTFHFNLLKTMIHA